METSSWIPVLQIAVAIMLPMVGFLAAQTIGNAKSLSRLEGRFESIQPVLKDIKARLASIEEAVRK